MNDRDDKPLRTADLAGAAGAQRPADPAAHPERAERKIGAADDGRPAPLLPQNETEQYRQRWNSIQTGFVDEPRKTVEQGDALVAQVMKRLADTFTDERSRLEQQWSRGGDVSTEDLRVALQRYRSFFDRLLSM